MRVLGVDLAWGEGPRPNETGVVAVEPDGRVIDAGWTTGVEDTAAWIARLGADDALVMVDAPLLVLNPTRQRLCEREVGQRYGRWKVSANSTNLGTVRQAGVTLREALETQGWTYSDGVEGPPTSGRTVSECYPYTAIVGAVELGYETQRPTYKRKPAKLSTAEWRPTRAAACDELIERMRTLKDADAALDISSHPATSELITTDSPVTDRDYKHREDLIDTCLSAWAGQLWLRHGFNRCQVLGATDPLTLNDHRATIIAPARNEQRAAQSPGGARS
jgi:predicted RNase H-like nuclease